MPFLTKLRSSFWVLILTRFCVAHWDMYYYLVILSRSWECPWRSKQRECAWHHWLPTWAQLLKGPFLVGPMSPLGEGGALFPPHCQRVEVEQTRSLRGKKKKDKLDGFLSSCYAAPLQDPLEQNRCPVAPRSGMQVHTPGVIPSKPRIFLTDLGSLELSSRGKGTEKTCVWRWLCLSRSQSQG